MIKEVDDALLEILKKGLSELLPSRGSAPQKPFASFGQRGEPPRNLPAGA
jgi:hypothetical protein